MKQTLLTLAATITLAFGSAFAGEPVNVAGDSGVALNGYDPVAFFTKSAPVHGDPGIKAEHDGATYFFASKDHRKTFQKNPDKYAPQFGGYCAYGVALGALFPVDVSTWQVVDEKLYLNLNPAILEVFNEDVAGNLEKAGREWAKLTK